MPAYRIFVLSVAAIAGADENFKVKAPECKIARMERAPAPELDEGETSG